MKFAELKEHCKRFNIDPVFFCFSPLAMATLQRHYDDLNQASNLSTDQKKSYRILLLVKDYGIHIWFKHLKERRSLHIPFEEKSFSLDAFEALYFKEFMVELDRTLSKLPTDKREMVLKSLPYRDLNTLSAAIDLEAIFLSGSQLHKPYRNMNILKRAFFLSGFLYFCKPGLPDDAYKRAVDGLIGLHYTDGIDPMKIVNPYKWVLLLLFMLNEFCIRVLKPVELLHDLGETLAFFSDRRQVQYKMKPVLLILKLSILQFISFYLSTSLLNILLICAGLYQLNRIVIQYLINPSYLIRSIQDGFKMAWKNKMRVSIWALPLLCGGLLLLDFSFRQTLLLFVITYPVYTTVLFVNAIFFAKKVFAYKDSLYRSDRLKKSNLDDILEPFLTFERWERFRACIIFLMIYLFSSAFSAFPSSTIDLLIGELILLGSMPSVDQDRQVHREYEESSYLNISQDKARNLFSDYIPSARFASHFFFNTEDPQSEDVRKRDVNTFISRVVDAQSAARDIDGTEHATVKLLS